MMRRIADEPCTPRLMTSLTLVVVCWNLAHQCDLLRLQPNDESSTGQTQVKDGEQAARSPHKLGQADDPASVSKAAQGPGW